MQKYVRSVIRKMVEENNDRTLYDGRQQFHKRLDNLWINIYICLANNNYEGVFTAFSGVLIETAGLISFDKTIEFENRVDNIYLKSKMLNNGKKINSNMLSDYSIKKEFRALAIEIRQLTKRLYLPLEEFDTEFDEEKFLKESEG